MHVCVVAYKFYESTPRVMMFANALARRGDCVEVIALRRPGQPAFEKIDGVLVHRIQERTRDERSPLTYLFRILTFFFRAAVRITERHLRDAYDLMHVFSVPDFLVFTALIPRLLGTPVLLDCYDLVPEFYASKFSSRESSFLFRLLVRVEKVSMAFSHHVVLPIEVWKDRVVSRSAPEGKCSVIRYHPDPRIFFPRRRVRRDDLFILIYPGILNSHQGLDIAIRAFGRIAPLMPKAEFHIYGEGSEEPSLRKLVNDLSLSQRVTIQGFLPAAQIAAVIADADIGIVPKRASLQFGNEAPSTKILDFMALGVPVIASRTAVEESYLDDSVIEFFTSENEEQLANAMLHLSQNENRRAELSTNASEYISRNNGGVKQRTFLRIVDSMCLHKRPQEAAVRSTDILVD